MTVEQHLTLFAKIKGMTKSETVRALDYLIAHSYVLNCQHLLNTKIQ